MLPFVLCLFSFTSNAQNLDSLSVSPADKAMALTNKLEREMELTPHQKDKVYMVLLNRSEQWQKLVSTAKQSDKPTNIAKLNAKAIKSLSHIFTKQQLLIYQESRQNLKQQKALNGTPSFMNDEDLELDL